MSSRAVVCLPLVSSVLGSPVSLPQTNLSEFCRAGSPLGQSFRDAFSYLPLVQCPVHHPQDGRGSHLPPEGVGGDAFPRVEAGTENLSRLSTGYKALSVLILVLGAIQGTQDQGNYC